VVEVYIKGSNKQEPLKQLVGFKRVAVDEKGYQEFEIDIEPFWLRQFDENTQEMSPLPSSIQPTLLVGFSSADRDLIEIK